MTNQTTTNEIYTGSEISIYTGGAIGYSAVVVSMVHGTVESQTDKAIKVRCGNHTLWLPKKVLVAENSYYKLARWFRGNRYQEWFLEHYASVSGQSAL